MKFWVHMVETITFQVYVFICTEKSEQLAFSNPPTHPNLNIVQILKLRTYYWRLPNMIKRWNRWQVTDHKSSKYFSSPVFFVLIVYIISLQAAEDEQKKDRLSVSNRYIQGTEVCKGPNWIEGGCWPECTPWLWWNLCTTLQAVSNTGRSLFGQLWS